MATTYLKAHHISRGETIAQSMRDRFDYGQNPDKTEQGELIMAYECDPRTADAEFLLTKARYKVVTGREQKRDADVLCYQIRQSFPPGEIDHQAPSPLSYLFQFDLVGLHPEIPGFSRLGPRLAQALRQGMY